MLTTVELMKLFKDYVGDCILLTELGCDHGNELRPLSFDEWYVRIYLRNIAANPECYTTGRQLLMS